MNHYFCCTEEMIHTVSKTFLSMDTASDICRNRVDRKRSYALVVSIYRVNGNTIWGSMFNSMLWTMLTHPTAKGQLVVDFFKAKTKITILGCPDMPSSRYLAHRRWERVRNQRIVAADVMGSSSRHRWPFDPFRRRASLKHQHLLDY